MVSVCFESRENLLQKWYITLCIRLSQSSEMAFESWSLNLCKRKTDFLERGLVLKRANEYLKELMRKSQFNCS